MVAGRFTYRCAVGPVAMCTAGYDSLSISRFAERELHRRVVVRSGCEDADCWMDDLPMCVWLVQWHSPLDLTLYRP
jgi:hypothetical protein